MESWYGHCPFRAAANSLSNYRYNASESLQGMYEPKGQVGSKKVMMRSNAPLYPLETKTDALADRLADMSLIIKKNPSRDEAAVFRPVHVRTCTYCKLPGHGANRCDANSHRDTKCPPCETFGRSATSYWAINSPRMGGRSSYAPKKTQADDAVPGTVGRSAEYQVSDVTHDERPTDEKLVALGK